MFYDDVPAGDGDMNTDGGIAGGAPTTPADGADTEEKDGEGTGEAL